MGVSASNFNCTFSYFSFQFYPFLLLLYFATPLFDEHASSVRMSSGQFDPFKSPQPILPYLRMVQ